MTAVQGVSSAEITDPSCHWVSEVTTSADKVTEEADLLNLT